MTTTILLACLAFATAFVAVRSSSGAAGVAAPSVDSRAQGPDARVSAPDRCPSDRRGLAFYSRRLNEWRAKMGAGAARPAVLRIHRIRTCPQIRVLAERWRAKARATRLAFELWFERTYEKWRCIHEHEGSWTDPNYPYWGGLQMTRWFQQTYGREFYARWGTADGWPVWAQLVAAERAWRECSCFRQWGTAWRCGLR